MPVELRNEPFSPWQEIAAYESRLSGRPGRHGATSVFIGSMRDFNQGDTVHGMALEHYPGMTEKYLNKICAEANSRWAVDESLIIHRIGKVTPGESIVLVAIWSAHRDPALHACRYIIEELKHRAPFWKQETLESGNRWVSNNTSAKT